MNSPIKLVQGDNRPYITLTLLDDYTGNPIDLTASGTIVRVHFRSVETNEILSTIETTKLNSGLNGEVMFNFPGSALEVKAGNYLGHVEVDFSGEVHTVYEPLEFYVRRRYATDDY